MRARDRDRASTGYTGPALATQGQHWLHRASYTVQGQLQPARQGLARQGHTAWHSTGTGSRTAWHTGTEACRYRGTEAHRPL